MIVRTDRSEVRCTFVTRVTHVQHSDCAEDSTCTVWGMVGTGHGMLGVWVRVPVD